MFRQDCNEMHTYCLGGEMFGDSGCAISSVFHHIEQITGLCFTPRAVQLYLIDMKTVGIIDEDFFVKSWDKAFSFMGVRVSTRFEPADYICHSNEIEILKLVKPSYTHFVPGDGTGHYSWDSLGRRDTQKDYKVFDKRIMILQG